MKKIFLATLVLGVFAVAANAQILLDDNFDRPDGSLAGTTPTPGPGGVWTNHSGTVGDLLLSGGQAVVQHGVPSEDAHSIFGSQSVGVLAASFDINVNASEPIGTGGTTDFEYFSHFMADGTFNFYSRLYVVAPNSSGDYTLGLSTSSGGFTEMLPTDFNFGDTLNVTLRFDFGAGVSSLTVGGDTITSSVVVPGATLDSFALRQSDSSQNESINVDNLVVSIVPEPSTIALCGFGFLTLLLARRRC